MGNALFDAPRTRKRRTNFCTDIVPLDQSRCLRCRGPITTETYRQSALFWSHGHGATLQLTFVRCECGWFSLSDSTEVKPTPEERAIARPNPPPQPETGP